MSQQNIRSRSGGISAGILETVPEESTETGVPTLADQMNDLDDWIAEFVSSDVTVEDLLSSTEFLDEQKKILLEFEARRVHTEENQDTPSPPRRPRRRGRSSIGVKIACPICLESLNTPMTLREEKMVTECGHIFCKSCIEDVCALKKESTLCPVCRENVGQLRKIFI